MAPPPASVAVSMRLHGDSIDALDSTGAVRSDELEKLLNAWGASAAVPYDAETMIDQLLANTWAAPPPKRTSLRTSSAASGGVGQHLMLSPSSSAAAAGSRTESFTRQTKSMNELETVLADSIERLLRHRQAISDRITALEKDNLKVTAKFQDGLKNPEQLLQHICVQMEDLEERFTKVSSTAVVIGDKLATLDQERTRVLDTDEMMEALLALNDPNSKLTRSNNRLFTTLQDKHQLHEAARVVKKMLVFSTELSAPSIGVAVNEIERLSQTIENDLLAEFSDAQERDQYKIMRKCAESLIEYNDKDKVSDRYVWNIMKDALAKSLESARADDASSLNPIQDLESLYSKIRSICHEQFVVIDHVFPAATCTSIRELLVERLFNDPAFGIFSYLDVMLSTRSTSSSSASTSSTNPEYVRLLCAAYERTCSLAQQIEMLEIPLLSSAAGAQAARVVPVANVGIYSPLGEATELATTPLDPASQLGDRERMRAFLALQLHSLFGSHRQRYFKTELDLVQTQLRELFAAVKFPAPVVPIKQKAKAAKASDKTGDKNNSTSTGGSSPSLPPPPLQPPNTPSPNGLAPPTPSSSSLEREIASASSVAPPATTVATTESAVLAFYESLLAIAQDDDVALQYADRMKDALERCDIILKDNEMRGELITKLFSSFMASFMEDYLAKLLAMIKELLQEPLASANSATQFFSVLEHVLKRIDFVDDQFDTVISPMLGDWPTQLTICYESKRKCSEKLERAIAGGLQQVLTVVDKTLAQMLATTQDKSDFIGSETNMSLSCSRACKKCIDYLQPLVALIARVLLAENRDRFLIGLSSIFKDLYLQHLQKFRFDPDGACMLLRDVNAYRQIFRGYRHDAIDAMFDILHEVANIFALPPENVGSFIRDGKLATMTRQSLVDILKRRWDYKTHGDKLQLQL